MPIITKLFALIVVCTFAFFLTAAEKVVLSSENDLLPQVKSGKVWNNDKVYNAPLPIEMYFANPLTLMPGKTYTLSAEVRSTGGTTVHDQSTKTDFWIGFIIASASGNVQFDIAKYRVFPELAEIVKPAKAADSSLIVKGKLSRWAEIKGVPLYIATNAKEDGSDLPNHNLIKFAANGISKTSDGNWEIKLSRYHYLQQDIPTGTKLALHACCQFYDFVNEKSASAEWTSFSGSFKPETQSTVVVGLFCIDEHGEIEIRNIRVTEK